MLLRNGVELLSSSSVYFAKPANDSYTTKYDEEVSTASTTDYISVSWSYTISTNSNSVDNDTKGRIICSSSMTATQPSDSRLDDKIAKLIPTAYCISSRKKFSLSERPYIEYSQTLQNVGDTAVTVNKLAYYRCSNDDDAYNQSIGVAPEVGNFSSPAAMILCQNLNQPVTVQAGESKNFLIRFYISE